MIIIPANTLSTGGYEIANSCRFNRGDSPYLSRTQSTSPTHDDKCTMSFWFKQGSQAATASRGFSFGGSDDTSNRSHFYIETDGQLYSYGKLGGSVHLTMNSTRMLRDSGAWYHYCLAVDTTQSTAANRVREYINNVEITSYVEATYPSQNDNFPLVKGSRMLIGAIRGGSDQIYNHSECYLAEVHFIDGQQLTPSSFAEYDEDSPTIWKPKDCKADLTYGTNGFYLEFKDSSALGDDTSGNGNDFTVSNLAAADQATDTPTNSFCTLNPLAAANNQPTFSQGNCQVVSGGAWYGSLGTFAVSAGKWYWEVKNTSTGGIFNGVIADYVDFDDATVYNEVGATSYSKDSGGEVHYGEDVTTADYGSLDQNDILGVALNMDDKQISFYDNNSAIVSNFALDDASNLDFVIPFNFEWDATVQYNFGGCSAFALSSAAQDENGYGNFEYAPPSGYLALCTKNLGSDGG